MSSSSICLMCYKLWIINSGVSSLWQYGTSGWIMLVMAHIISILWLHLWLPQNKWVLYKCVEGTESFGNSVLLRELSFLLKQGGGVHRGRLFTVLWSKKKQSETCSCVAVSDGVSPVIVTMSLNSRQTLPRLHKLKNSVVSETGLLYLQSFKYNHFNLLIIVYMAE
jgi:hypothetical protein